MNIKRTTILTGFLISRAFAQQFTGAASTAAGSSVSAVAASSAANAGVANAGYILGAGDQISVRVLDAEEINDKPVQIGDDGLISLPMVGDVKAAGMGVRELERDLAKRFGRFYVKPQVTVSVTDYRSQPVSVIGEVNNPGVYQLKGQRPFLEIFSMAGGLKSTAANTVNITRQASAGPLPLPNAVTLGDFSTAQINLDDVVQARKPELNIQIMPHDVISVARAELVYVVGEVTRPGGFPLEPREHMSVLQALALAGGTSRTASRSKAQLLRTIPSSSDRVPVEVNLTRIVSGKDPDVNMKANDILFIPDSLAKSATLRGVEAAINVGTGVIVWRH